MTGRIAKFESCGGVDGPGIRYVVFMQGCSLRCAYCHNPETWDIDGGTVYTVQDVFKKIIRHKSYFGENGGVTFSGGEPLLQADFLVQLAKLLRSDGIHITLDTSGTVLNKNVYELLSMVDLVLLDIKMTTEEKYLKYIGCPLNKAIEFLKLLSEKHIQTIVRYVTVPTINDADDEILQLKKICDKYPSVRKIELLPFKKLCLEKYEKLDIAFSFVNIPECSDEWILELENKLL